MILSIILNKRISKITKSLQIEEYENANMSTTDFEDLQDVQPYSEYENTESNTKNIDTTAEQKAIKEIINAYYQRGIDAQYCSWRYSRFYSPEEATSQHTIYSVCSNFTYSVYYQAFGIDIQGGYASTPRIIEYGREYYNPNDIVTNDIVEYWQKTTDQSNNTIYVDNNGNVKDIDLSGAEGRKKYAAKLLKECNLQIGDIICYHPGGNTSGHALIVYDIIYDKNGEPVDAVIRESTSSGHEQKTTKITKGLSYTKLLNENNNIYEGTFREMYLSNSYKDTSTATRSSLIYNARNMAYFTILRPLLKDESGNYTGQYYYATFKSQNTNDPTEGACTGRTLKDYKITNMTLNRMKYSSIYIEKTVDVFNNSIVNLGDTLEYTIKIKNNSSENYSNLEVVEDVSDKVEVLNNSNGSIEDNKIKWNISSLEPNKSIEIKYKVKVKKDISILGKSIISTGTVGGIPSSTVQNVISSDLKEDEKSKIKDDIQTMINDKNYYGQELISKVYNKSFGINLNLNDLDITDLIKLRNGLAYYPANAERVPTIYLNTENKFSNMVLSDYYGGLYTTDNGIVYIKNWENMVYPESRSQRADTVYKDNFKTGDILIYKNTQDPEGKDVTYQKEDGIYYLIYIDEESKITVDGEEFCGFIGINEDGKMNKITTDYTSLQTLLGKDYYAILRPSMTMDLVKMKLDVNYSATNKTNQDVTVTIKSNEKMLEVGGWVLSEDSLTVTKTYSANTTEEIAVYDYAGNKTTQTIEITNIDKTVPAIEIDYSSKELTNQDVTVTIKANKKIQQIEGWMIDGTQTILTKIFTENGEETVTISDLAGNKNTVNIKITNIDKSEIVPTVKYSTTLLTNKDVTVTIILNKEIQKVEGWELSEDKTQLTKIFTSNNEEVVEVQDLYGNTKKVQIIVKNIDKEKPKVEVNYSTTKTTNGDVVVTIKANKEMQEIDGWTLSSDKKSMTKTYSQNTRETITVEDLVGNNTKIEVVISNIYKDADNENKSYNNVENKQNTDLTIANGIIPKAGESRIIIFSIVIITFILLSEVLYIKLKKLRDIK